MPTVDAAVSSRPGRWLEADDAFAAALRRARKAAGLSQAQLAERLGFRTSVVAGIEQRIRCASVGEATAIAEALHTTVDFMTADVTSPLVEASPARARTSEAPPRSISARPTTRTATVQSGSNA